MYHLSWSCATTRTAAAAVDVDEKTLVWCVIYFLEKKSFVNGSRNCCQCLYKLYEIDSNLFIQVMNEVAFPSQSSPTFSASFQAVLKEGFGFDCRNQIRSILNLNQLRNKFSLEFTACPCIVFCLLVFNILHVQHPPCDFHPN